jgi:hypothetical protein
MVRKIKPTATVPLILPEEPTLSLPTTYANDRDNANDDCSLPLPEESTTPESTTPEEAKQRKKKDVPPKVPGPRKSKKQLEIPLVYAMNNEPQKSDPWIRRDVIITLQCTMEQINQIINAGDLYWFGTEPTPTWNPDTSVVPATTNVVPAYQPLDHIQYTSSEINDHPTTAICKEALPSAPIPSNLDYVYKLQNLKIHMYTSSHMDRELKASSCFWCTCPFSNEACHILKYGQSNEIQGVGAYCSPECAAAGLFNHTKMDDSEKFESYQLMNFCYQLTTPNDIDTVDKDKVKPRVNIRPAVSPFYFLDKFFGNMTADEFRMMNRDSKHLLYTLDKPLTRMLPEIHEEKELLTLPRINNPLTGSSKYRVKRQSEQVNAVSQMDILRKQFKLI